MGEESEEESEEEGASSDEDSDEEAAADGAPPGGSGGPIHVCSASSSKIQNLGSPALVGDTSLCAVLNTLHPQPS